MALEVKLFLKDHFSKTFGNVVKSLGRAVTQTLKWGVALAGVFTGIAIKKASDFQDQISQIATLAAFTTKEISSMGKEIKMLGIESGRALSELTKARYDIVSAGFVDVTQSMILMNEASKLAVAGASSVAATANILTSALNAYGYQADQTARISDVLFTTVKLGKTTIDELSGSLGQVMPFAKAAGVEIEGVGATMATLTLSGLDTAMAATALRSAFRNLSAPTKEARKEMETAGISVKLFEDGTMDLYETFKQFEGMSLDQITRFIPDVRAATAVLSLSGNVEILRKSFEEMEGASGAAATAYEKRLKTFRVQWDRLLNNMNVALIDIGEKMLEKITPIVTKINDELAKFGEIGWDNVGMAIIQNLSIIGKLMIDSIKIIGIAIGQAFKLAFQKIDWTAIGQSLSAGFKNATRKLFNLDPSIEEVKEQLDQLRAELENKKAYRTTLQIDTDIDLTKKLPSREQIQIAVDTKAADDAILQLQIKIKTLEAYLEDLGKDKIGDVDFTSNLTTAFEKLKMVGGDAFEKILEAAQALKDGTDEIDAETQTKVVELTEKQIAGTQEVEDAEKKAAKNTAAAWTESFKAILKENEELYNAINQIVGATGQAINSFDQMRKAQIAAEFDEKKENLTEWYERQKSTIEKTITNEELKSEKLKELDENYYYRNQTLKEQQVEAEKKAALALKPIKIAQAIANVALAVTQALAAAPPPWNFALAALVGAAGLAEVATIQAQPYAEGTMNVNAPLSDMIPATLTPGESVNTKEATSSYSAEIARLNQMAGSGADRTRTSGSGISSSGGGDTYNVTLYAMDSKSFEEFSRNNPRAFAEAFKSALKSRDVGYRPLVGAVSVYLKPNI
jgi:TP901 family phage tail tape measure protein